MLFDDEALQEFERIFENDSAYTGGLGNLRASGEGESIRIWHVGNLWV
jgi:hypothetical protein